MDAAPAATGSAAAVGARLQLVNYRTTSRYEGGMVGAIGWELR